MDIQIITAINEANKKVKKNDYITTFDVKRYNYQVKVLYFNLITKRSFKLTF